jgi:predicted membrane protein
VSGLFHAKGALFCLGFQVITFVISYLIVVSVVGQQDETHWRMALAAEDGFLEISTFTTGCWIHLAAPVEK